MIHIEIVNDKRVMQALQRAAKSLSDTGPLMAAIGSRLESNARQRFDSKTDPRGRKWADIKPISSVIYEAIHKKPLGGSLLERSGNLRDSIEAHVIAAGTGVEVGPAAPYAGYHEFGTKNMVRRGIVFGDVSGQGLGAQVSQALSPSDLQDVLNLVNDRIQGAI